MCGTADSLMPKQYVRYSREFNTLHTELNPICHFLALLGVSNIVVVSRLRVNVQTIYALQQTV